MRVDDARRGRLAQWLQFAAHTIYNVCALSILGQQRDMLQWGCVVGFTAFVDLFISRVRRGRWSFPLAGLISGGAIFLNMEGIGLAPYLLAGLAASASKHLLASEHRHAFNPGNFGILFAILLCPAFAVSSTSLWSNNLWFALLVLGCGSMVTWYADRWATALGYIVTFSAASASMVLLDRRWAGLSPDVATPVLFWTGTLLSSSSSIFIMHMVTDPMTTPSGRARQAMFGATVAATDLLLRRGLILEAPYLALSAICAIRYAFLEWTPPGVPAELRPRGSQG